MKKILLLSVLALLIGACQLFAPGTPTATPPLTSTTTPAATEPPVTPTFTPTQPPATAEPTLSVEEILAQLPFTPGVQPNGSFVVQELQQADLTGDGRQDIIVLSSWKQNEAEEFAAPLQVDVFSATGELLYTQNTWETLGASPSTMPLDETSFFGYDRIEAVDVISLTGDAVPQLVVRIRYAGTGSILEAHVLSFKGGVTASLADITAYKGWMEYQGNGYLVSQPLYLYNEPNCCPCRKETVTYAWDGVAFTASAAQREALESMECPAFPTPAEWRALAASGPLPPARRDAVLAYDTRRERLLLFGGRDGERAFNDTWAFDLNTSTWTEIVPPAALRPTPRYSAVAGLDALRERLVLVAGAGDGGAALNEVWTLNLAADVWQQQPISGDAPAARFGAAGGIADYSNTLILSHGLNGDRSFNDTWALDLETFTWRNVTPAGALPAARGWHSAAPLGGMQLALFGGAPLLQGDTWLLDLRNGSWRELTGPGPSARGFAGMATLSDRGAVLLFGGQGAGNVELNDVWLLDPSQNGWRQVQPGNAGPTPRQGHSMAWVGYSALTPGSAVAVFGGLSGGVMRNDLWLFIPWDE